MIRTLDVLFSGLALLVLSPLLLAVMVILRLSGEGEVFYCQQRVGQGGRHFGLLKFATMLKNSPNIGTGLHTLANDPRVLPFGRVLRKTKINELPQLVNILIGDMSIIGPRPQAPAHFDVFPEYVRRSLTTVKPGLSGIGSIVFRDEERLLSRPGIDHQRFYQEVIAPYKGNLEMWFLRHRNVTTYLWLIALTAVAVVAPRSQPCWVIWNDLPPLPIELQEV